MLEGTFVTVVGFRGYPDPPVYAIGNKLYCMKEPDNSRDADAIKVFTEKGELAGYLSNSPNTKAGGTLSASRIYDKVGKVFCIEICFTTRTKVICRVIDPDCKMEPKEE